MSDFLNTAYRWYEKAGDCADNYDQFISIWISFNSIYGSQHESYEIEKIKSTLHKLDNSSVDEIMSLNEVRFFIDIVNPIKYLDKENNLRDTGDWQQKLKSYYGRNNRIALENLLNILRSKGTDRDW
jgi:hypothetical protein